MDMKYTISKILNVISLISLISVFIWMVLIKNGSVDQICLIIGPVLSLILGIISKVIYPKSKWALVNIILAVIMTAFIGCFFNEIIRAIQV